MADRVKEVARDELAHVGTLAVQAAKSGAYLYPVQGILYFLGHRTLWQPFTSRLAPTVTLGLGVTAAMFFFTYVPQAAVLAFTSGPLAPFSAAVLVLSESATIVNALSRTFLLEDALLDTFDGTLVSRGCAGLVADGRQVTPGGGSDDPIARLGQLIRRPFARLQPRSLIRGLLYWPLNFVPVVGTLLYLVLQGRRHGPVAHQRYFQLKGWGVRQRDRWIESHRPAYTSFGVVASVLEMVPFAGLGFTFTNTVGAALWASDIERSVASEGGTSPQLREDATKAE